MFSVNHLCYSNDIKFFLLLSRSTGFGLKNDELIIKNNSLQINIQMKCKLHTR